VAFFKSKVMVSSLESESPLHPWNLELSDEIAVIVIGIFE
jgi:hypothetical protein